VTDAVSCLFLDYEIESRAGSQQLFGLFNFRDFGNEMLTEKVRNAGAKLAIRTADQNSHVCLSLRRDERNIAEESRGG